jgi:hypothetical protein
MPTINHLEKEINLKIVYYGPGLSGKTTNLKFLHHVLPPDLTGEMISLETAEERTLFFDFMRVDIGTIYGFKIRLRLYTVPGQNYYEKSRELVLRNADGIVFVADSQRLRREENLESMESMWRHLKELHIEGIPWIIQYNKRDLDEIEDIATLESLLNPNAVDAHQAVAKDGHGVKDTINNISKKVIALIK